MLHSSLGDRALFQRLLECFQVHLDGASFQIEDWSKKDVAQPKSEIRAAGQERTFWRRCQAKLPLCRFEKPGITRGTRQCAAHLSGLALTMRYAIRAFSGLTDGESERPKVSNSNATPGEPEIALLLPTPRSHFST